MELNKIYNDNCIKILKTLPENSINCIITSPPYNKGNTKGGDNWSTKINYDIYSDDKNELEYELWQVKILKECLRILKKDGSIFYNHKPRQVNNKIILPTNWLKNFDIRQIIIWQRTGSPNISPICFMQNTEWIIWIKKGIPKFHSKYFNLGEVWKINPEINSEHPAPFPI